MEEDNNKSNYLQNGSNLPSTTMTVHSTTRVYGAEPPKVIRIGIFDSGEGGTRFTLDMFKRLLPHLDKEFKKYSNCLVQFVVVGDGETCPWGNRPENEIVNLTENMIKRSNDLGCDLTIIACNTASVAYNKAIEGDSKSLKEKYRGENIIDLIEETTKFYYQRTLKNYYEKLCKNSDIKSAIKHDTKSVDILTKILSDFPDAAHDINYGVLSTYYTFEQNTYPEQINKLHEDTLRYVLHENPALKGYAKLTEHSYAPVEWVPLIEGAALENNNIFYPSKAEEGHKFVKYQFFKKVDQAFGEVTKQGTIEMVNNLFACTHYGDPLLMRSFYDTMIRCGHENTKIYSQGEIFVGPVAKFISEKLREGFQASYTNQMNNNDRVQVFVSSTGSKAGHSLFEKDPEMVQVTHDLSSTPKATKVSGKVVRLTSDQVDERLNNLTVTRGVLPYNELKAAITVSTEQAIQPAKQLG